MRWVAARVLHASGKSVTVTVTITVTVTASVPAPPPPRQNKSCYAPHIPVASIPVVKPTGHPQLPAPMKPCPFVSLSCKSAKTFAKSQKEKGKGEGRLACGSHQPHPHPPCFWGLLG